MYYVYILKSNKHGQFYIGRTSNVIKRLEQHNLGLSRSTKRYLPWKLVYIEGYANLDDVKDREVKLKQFGKVYSQLKRRIKRSLQS
ncbi:MAG: GIY-YIG nuclease family protein [bacterium]|nr:GIY-YIG nuclease family protein [bacterium]